jgi:hypothetical protein
VAKIAIITGRRGKGKTSLAYFLAKETGRGVAIFDPTQSFGIGAIAHDRTSFEYILDGDISPAVLQVENSDFKKNAVEEKLQDFVASIRHIQDIGVVIDETSYVQSAQYCAPALDDEVRVGRRRRHDLFLTQHRMADCNGIVLDLVTEFYFFQTKSPKSLDRIAEYCGDLVAGTVSVLDEHEFCFYDVETGNTHVNNQPEFWRVQIAPQEVAAPRLSQAAD